MSSEEKNRYIVEQVLQQDLPVCDDITDSIGCKQRRPTFILAHIRSFYGMKAVTQLVSISSRPGGSACIGERLDYFAPHLQFVDVVIDIHQGKQKSTGEKHP